MLFPNIPCITTLIIDEILANITNNNFMSSTDLTSGYSQIEIKLQDKAKTKPFLLLYITFSLLNIGVCELLKNEILRQLCFQFPIFFLKIIITLIKPVQEKKILFILIRLVKWKKTFIQNLLVLQKLFNLLYNIGLTENLKKRN